jgi:serine/threonine protein kinase
LFLESRLRSERDRADFLYEACGSDLELRSEVEALLAHNAEHSLSSQEGGMVASTLLHSERLEPGDLIAGRYRIVCSLGHGGMSEVYGSEDLTLDVPVALKFLRVPAALDAATRAMRLDPQAVGPSLMGRIHYEAGRIETGVMWLEQGRAANPEDIPARVLLASHYQEVGRHAEARVLVAELLGIHPSLTLDAAAVRGAFGSATAEQIAGTLLTAGFPARR